VFAQVSVSTDGRYIIWPGDLDFCVDALHSAASVPAGTPT
jgi:hypothetical protein